MFGLFLKYFLSVFVLQSFGKVHVHHLRKRELFCSVSLPTSAMGWSLVCDCFFIILYYLSNINIPVQISWGHSRVGHSVQDKPVPEQQWGQTWRGSY